MLKDSFFSIIEMSRWADSLLKKRKSPFLKSHLLFLYT